MKIVTHSGSFHQDELFALAALQMVYPDAEIIRTRDPEIISKADIAVDIGGIYDPASNRFDHHQEGGAGRRGKNGMPYASFGLVWKKFGRQICDGRADIADLVDRKMIQAIDAADNGVMVYAPVNREIQPYLFDNFLNAITPTWREGKSIDDAFKQILSIVRLVLEKEIEKAKFFFEETELVRQAYRESEDKRIIVLDHPYPWKSVLTKYPEPLFVIYQDQNTDEWVIMAVKKDPRAFIYRKLFPANWAGKIGKPLADEIGIPDAVFCHNKRFIAKAWSKESAIKMAKIGLNT
ncbi:MAG TPA: MYG1 family protein [Candidatus Paceibacterota bacterium]|nr:MYG1 family protein [Candidatus Paceibacterota bacterium]